MDRRGNIKYDISLEHIPNYSQTLCEFDKIDITIEELDITSYTFTDLEEYITYNVTVTATRVNEVATSITEFTTLSASEHS